MLKANEPTTVLQCAPPSTVVGDGCVVGVAAVVGDGADVPDFDPPGDVPIDDVGVPPAHATSRSPLKTSKVMPVIGCGSDRWA